MFQQTLEVVSVRQSSEFYSSFFYYIGIMNWWLVLEIVYISIVILVCLRIIYETRSTTKTLSYLLVTIFIPIFGMIFYFFVGVNYRNRKIYSKKLKIDADMDKRLRKRIMERSRQLMEHGNEALVENKALAKLLLHDEISPLTRHNCAEILVNGEEKFPRLIESLKSARHHIHMEYYIYEPDIIGREIAEVLKQKAREGVTVRLIYDDFGSRRIRHRLVRELREAGVNAMPFYRIKLIALANRINYRNHRKIAVVDGREAFVGGINVGDSYYNRLGDSEPLYWRDTHLYLTGPVVRNLQYLFLTDWNFCAKDNIELTPEYFPETVDLISGDDRHMQIVSSGPDSATPSILFSILQAIMLADQEVLITTPYFIPGESLLNILVIAAKSGIDVRILVPKEGDSWFVSRASQSYYGELMEAGVRIFQYKKGFIHAKTMVVDGEVSMVGTANMDIRSFDHNFEVNAIIYDEEIGEQMRQIFFDDVRFSEEIDPEQWLSRPWYVNLGERVARLFSPLL